MPNPDFFKPFATSFALFGLTPQYPIRLQSYDGQTYIYYSDCCEPDNHVGLLYSGEELSPLGCQNAAPAEGFPYPVPGSSGSTTPTGGGSTSTTTPSALIICEDPSFSNVVGANFNKTGLTTYPNYYPSGLTAFAIQDKNSLVRWFTLTKIIFTFTSDGGGVFNLEFPILLQSRPHQRIEYSDGSVDDPVNSWVLPNKVPLNWSTDLFGVVTIQIPKPDFSGLEFVTCYLINRLR